MRDYLVDVEGAKKEKEAQIRQTMQEHRAILIKEFEQNLIEMENRLMEQIISLDEDFISSIGSIDSQLAEVGREVGKS